MLTSTIIIGITSCGKHHWCCYSFFYFFY